MLTQDQQDKILGALLKKPENALCADCGSKSPCWASLDFGVFVCMNCSGAHRSLGQSVTRIKSTKLDTWNKDWVWHMQLNNKMVNQYFQASLNPVLHKKPNPSSSLNDIKKFVLDKYVRRLFAQSGQDDPITNLKNGKPPLKISSSQSQSQAQKPISVSPDQKLPQKSLNTQSISIKQVKKTNLLDDVSDQSNRVPSINNDKIRQEVNLFQEVQEQKKSPENFHPGHLYNKEHYNSFSGKGATHSSTGTINFDSIFGPHLHTQKNKNVSFEEFNNISMISAGNYGSTVGSSNHNTHQYGHIHQHHLPHMHLYSTGIGTGLGHNHNPQHHFTTPPQPTHVTMNINMNMYSNIMNINLQDNPSTKPQSQSQSPLTLTPTPNQPLKANNNISDSFKLDINDFKLSNEKAPEIQNKGKSWVDDWK